MIVILNQLMVVKIKISRYERYEDTIKILLEYSKSSKRKESKDSKDERKVC